MESKTPQTNLAVQLHDYIGAYQPPLWIVPIKDVVITPFFTEKQIEELAKAHEANSLQALMEKSGTLWYVREAITSFFNNYQRQKA